MLPKALSYRGPPHRWPLENPLGLPGPASGRCGKVWDPGEDTCQLASELEA